MSAQNPIQDKDLMLNIYLLRLLEKAVLVYQNKMTETEYQAPFDPSGVIPGTTREVTEQPLNALGFHLPSSLNLFVSTNIWANISVSYPIDPKVLPYLKLGHVVYYLTQFFQQVHEVVGQNQNKYDMKIGDIIFGMNRENPIVHPKGYPFIRQLTEGPYVFSMIQWDLADKQFFNHFNKIQSYAWPEAADMYDWFFQDERGIVEFNDIWKIDKATGKINRDADPDPVKDWRNTVKNNMIDFNLNEDETSEFLPLTVFTEYEIKLGLTLRNLTPESFNDFVNPEVPYVKEEEDAIDEFGNKVLDDEGYIVTVQVDRPVVGEEALQSMPADETYFPAVTAYLRKKGLL